MKITSDLIDFIYITDEEEIDSLIEFVSSLPPNSYLAIDTESYPLYEYGDRASGLDAHTSRVRLISLFHPEYDSPVVIDCHRVEKEEVIKLLTLLVDHIVIAHNAIHDIKAISTSFRVDIPLKCTYVALCTLAVSTGWKAALMRGKGLADMARDLFSTHLSKELSISDWSSPELTKDQLIYSCLDVCAPKGSSVDSVVLRGYQEIEKVCCEDLDEAKAFYLDQSIVPINAEIGLNGLPMNEELLRISLQTISPQVDEAILKLCNLLSLPVEQRVSFTNGSFSKVVYVPPHSSKLLNNNAGLVKFVTAKLRKSGESINDLQADTLLAYIKSLEQEDQEDEVENYIEDISSDIELIKLLLSYKKLSKMKSEIEKYLSNLNPVTNNLHTNTNVIGTATGRMSSSGGSGQARVNIQQISTIPFVIEYEDENQLFDL